MAKYSLIYEPTGRAKEYVPEEHGFAANLWDGCDNGCIYCFAPGVLHMDRKTFYETPQAKKDVIERLNKDLAILEERKPGSVVFLCFTCDPFQPRVPERDNVIWQAIFAFLSHNIKVRILTKAGDYSSQVFKFYESEDTRHLLDYGTSLIFADDRMAKLYEPNAAPTSERIRVLKEAKEKGISTWASLEPVWDPVDTLELIERVAPYADIIKVGKLNHHKRAAYIDWAKFGKDAEKLCRKHKTDFTYYLKKDLRDEMLKPGLCTRECSSVIPFA